MVFSGNAEAEVIVEGKQKSSYEETLSPVVGKRGSSPRMRGKQSEALHCLIDSRVGTLPSVCRNSCTIATNGVVLLV
ncbi:head protein [Bifidobacterium pseudolongum subsp. globosum]|uniref:Head protein n=1 Tax=Bifidobacterium pseudolongum subsp. globosum TaxID=1690 RepID=A0A4Q4ZZT5_9BIFI|nr:head protein [Bifidobacterium pseudolongum subsp. globosum]